MEGDAAAEEELERRSKFLNSLIQRKKAVEQQRHRSGVRVRACDMPAALQDAAFRLSREIIDSMHGGKLDSKRLALTLKKEFDCSYGPAWHCIVGTSFGSYVTHSLGGFLYFSIDKIPFSESFPQHINLLNPVMCPPLDYFATLLLGLVNNVIPPLGSSTKSTFGGDTLNGSARAHNKVPSTTQAGQMNSADGQRTFYQIQDPGTYTQLMLETAVIELLSLPVPASQIASSLVQIVVNIQPTLIQSSNSIHGTPNSTGQALPTLPSGGSTDSLTTSRSSPSVSGFSTSNFVWRSGYTCQQLSSLLIQACGLLLAQLPTEFHCQLYAEAFRMIKESWWLTDGKRSSGELDSAVGYALLDPTWAAQDNTSTAIGNIVALLHSFFSNLPQEWLEGEHAIIKHLRPVTSVAMLRIAFRIMGPLLPRLANAHSLFNKTLSLLLGVMVDVFGRNAQSSTPAEASEIIDLVDFLHQIVHYEGQGGPEQANSKPRVLALIGKACESLHPDVQHILSHLIPDANSSVYAATQPKIMQNPPAT